MTSKVQALVALKTPPEARSPEHLAVLLNFTPTIQFLRRLPLHARELLCEASCGSVAMGGLIVPLLDLLVCTADHCSCFPCHTQRIQYRKVDAGELVYHAGEVADNLFIVLSGVC